MITLKNESGEFLLRVAGILIHNEKVLMMRTKTGDGWVLPGGRAEINEKTSDTVVREFIEELGIRVKVDRLLGIIENFNAYGRKELHEFGVYYIVEPIEPLAVEDNEFFGTEDLRLTFNWIPLSDLEKTRIYPTSLKHPLVENVREIKHLINDDLRE